MLFHARVSSTTVIETYNNVYLFNDANLRSLLFAFILMQYPMTHRIFRSNAKLFVNYITCFFFRYSILLFL